MRGLNARPNVTGRDAAAFTWAQGRRSRPSKRQGSETGLISTEVAGGEELVGAPGVTGRRMGKSTGQKQSFCSILTDQRTDTSALVHRGHGLNSA